MLVKGLFIVGLALVISACATDSAQNRGYDHHSYCQKLAQQIHSTEDLNTQARNTAITHADSVKAYENADCGST